VIVPKADSVARARARQLADSLLGELRKGADFAALARKYSQDSATREAGGELGWFRRGMMVKPFEAVAFRLRPGELSDPVESSFGFHIIQVERIQPAEILARHILITPTISVEQIRRARALADSIHDALQHGASFDDLARRYADEDEPKLAEGVALTDLPPEYQRLYAADTTLGLKPVVTIGEGTPRPKFAVIEVTKRQPAGDLAFDDVKDRIRTSLAQELAVQHYVDQLRHSTYVDIRL
jgi:peptidyl-prolyl cis-trans isomerase SurA